MPTVEISPFFNSHHHDNNGNPASGWLVYTYYSRTTQKKDTYKDPQGISKHENPITLDARGEYPGGGLFLIAGETYSIVLKDPNSETELTWHSVIGGTEGIAPEAVSHTDLSNRDVANQHPISAITDLSTNLSDKVSKSTTSDQTIKSSLIVDGNSTDSASVKIYGNFSTGASRVDVTGASGQVQVIASATGDPWVKVKNETSGSVAYVYPEEVSVSNSSGTAYSRVDINGLTMTGQSKITFDTTPDSATLNEGVIQWDATDSTLAIGMGNRVVQQVGAELPHKAKNVSGTTFVDGQIGYIFGASGQRISMKKPTASDITAIKALFMATQTVADNNTGFFNALGVVHGVDTNLFAEGAEVWLDTTAGVITDTAPAKPNYQARMGYVVISHATNGSIFFHPDIQPKLGDLSDVIDTESLIGAEITKNASGVYKAFWPIVNEDDANSAISPNANVWINNAALTEDRTFALPTPFKGKSLEISNRGSSELFDVIIIPTYPNTLQYGIPSLSLKGGNASGLKGLILRGMSNTTWAIVSTCNL